MNGKLRVRFWLELAFGSLTASLSVLTLVWRDWIELLFKVEPDRGDGSLEWAIVGALLLATVVLAWLARVEWRRTLARES